MRLQPRFAIAFLATLAVGTLPAAFAADAAAAKPAVVVAPAAPPAAPVAPAAPAPPAVPEIKSADEIKEVPGVDTSKLVVSASAHVIPSYNTTLDKVTERFLGNRRAYWRLLIRGAVPGGKNGYLIVTNAATRTEYKRKGVGKEEVRSKNPLKASKKAAAGRG